MRGNITVAHAKSKHGQYFALDFIGKVSLVLFDKLRLERSGTVTRRIKFETAGRRLDCFAGQKELY